MSLWVRDRSGWALIGVRESDQRLRDEIAAEGLDGTLPERRLRFTAIVTSVRGIESQIVSSGSSTVAVDAVPLPGATLRLVAGDGGTPVPESTELVTGKDGRARLEGLLTGHTDDWCVDISAPGHCSVREWATVFRVDVQDPEPRPYHLFPGVARVGRVIVGGKPPPPGTHLSYALSELGPTLPIHVSVERDGAFRIIEPRGAAVEYVVTVPERGVVRQVSRRADGGELRIECD